MINHYKHTNRFTKIFIVVFQDLFQETNSPYNFKQAINLLRNVGAERFGYGYKKPMGMETLVLLFWMFVFGRFFLLLVFTGYDVRGCVFMVISV